jgi:hypothetical protein
VLPLAASQSRRVLSAEPETMRRPSGLKATDDTGRVWPRRGGPVVLPLAASQSRRVLSAEPETMRRPSGLKATDHTELVWP